jgi:hypothetical protein
MPVQYLYPSGDVGNEGGSWNLSAGSTPPYYQHLDEGVDSPDGAWVQASNYSATSVGLSQLTSPLLVHPEKITFRIHGRHGGFGDIDLTRINIQDLNGNYIALDASDSPPLLTMPAASSSFETYEYDMTNIITAQSGNWNASTPLYLGMTFENSVKIFDTKVDAVEVEISGNTTIPYWNNNDLSLYTRGSLGAEVINDIPLHLTGPEYQAIASIVPSADINISANWRRIDNGESVDTFEMLNDGVPSQAFDYLLNIGTHMVDLLEYDATSCTTSPQNAYFFIDWQNRAASVVGNGDDQLFIDEVYFYDKNGVTIAHNTSMENQLNVPNDRPFKTRNSGELIINEAARNFWDLSQTSITFQINIVGTGVDLSLVYLHGVEIEAVGYTYDIANTGALPLFIAGTGVPINSGISLYLQQNQELADIDLFTEGMIAESGLIPLFVEGGTANNNVDLYLDAHLADASGIDLYVKGSIGDEYFESMPLYTKGPILHSGTQDITLFTWSTTNSGVFNNIPLYMKVRESGIGEPYNENMPLFTKGPAYGEYAEGMPLFTKNVIPQRGGNLPLFAGNYTQSGENSVNLYVSGGGTTEGALPYAEGMPLFMARNANSLDKKLDLYLRVNDSSFDSMDLYLNATYKSNDNLPLVLPNTESSGNREFNLYTHGF